MGAETATYDLLVERLRGGDQAALGELFTLNREKLRKMVELRLDPRLRGRVSCSDVIQETYIDAVQRVKHFAEKPDMPFHVWLRLVANQRLVDVHRQHLAAQKRDAGCEVSLQAAVSPAISSVCLAACLAAQLDSPSQIAMRKEQLE